MIQFAAMLRSCLFLFLFVAATNAGGDFLVLNSPKGISFKGRDSLGSQYVGDVLLSAMGNAVQNGSNWNSMIISDPFSLANVVVAVYVDGIDHISSVTNAISFPLKGDDTEKSLNVLAAYLESSNEPVCDINFKQHENGVEEFKSFFGDIAVPSAKPIKHLNPNLHSADKQFLEEIGYLNAVCEHLTEMEANLLIVRLSLENIVKAHGGKSEAVVEANKKLSSSIACLLAASQKSEKPVMLVQLINKPDHNRVRREVLEPNDKKNELNLSEIYDENYPVIFNIILWFMVIFALSLLAICYAIGSMDPGRDSIIYRMTSTRMKKDN